MDTIIKEFIKDAPGIGALIVIVVYFLRYLKERDKMWQVMHDEHIEARKLSRESIDRNSDRLHENTDSNHKLADRIDKIQFFCPMATSESHRQHSPPRKNQ